METAVLAENSNSAILSQEHEDSHKDGFKLKDWDEGAIVPRYGYTNNGASIDQLASLQQVASLPISSSNYNTTNAVR